MPTTQRHVLLLAIDTFSARGELIGSLLGARTIETAADAHGILDEVFHGLPASYRQLSGAEVAELMATRRPEPEAAWEQLSIF